MFRIAGFVALLAAGAPLTGQMDPGCCMKGAGYPAPIASSPVVELGGTIVQVHIAPGQSVPYLELKHGTESTRVFLGPMHYLISENFSPKTGQEVSVKGFQQPGGIVAIQVTLPRGNQTLKLRDDNGWPLWRGGPRRGRGRMTSRPPAPN